MSRIGNRPVIVPSGVEVRVGGNMIITKGSKGELSSPLYEGISFNKEGDVIHLSCVDSGGKEMKARYGLVRALLANNIIGVSKGFERVLELKGVGYRAQAQGKKINLALGFSHPVEYNLPDGVEAKVEQNRIIINGISKQKVGQVASEIRAIRPPEPYKGKGVRYADERVIMKEGKKA
jgi:large subunit ribosomal protein L6